MELERVVARVMLAGGSLRVTVAVSTQLLASVTVTV